LCSRDCPRLEKFPIEVTPILPTYEETVTMDDKFEALKEAIKRSKRLSNRQMYLVNVYFLSGDKCVVKSLCAVIDTSLLYHFPFPNVYIILQV
jgi:hypothetical protein